MVNEKLREVVLDTGSPDPMDWNADSRREVVIAHYEADERTRAPSWITEALVERLDDSDRLALIEAMKHDSPAMRYAAIGIIVERALMDYPLDTLQQTAEERMPEWRSEERECAAERDRESRIEDRMLRGAL